MVILLTLHLFQNYRLFLTMFRVLLKIDLVSLRIREPVHLHIIIRKDHKYFTHCKNQLLHDGEARPSNSSEFLVDSQNPKFEIEIYLIAGDNKKKGGVVLLNLKNYSINVSHRITQSLKKTPLHNSSLCLDFVYMHSQHCFEGQSLISLQKMEQIMHRMHLKEISEQHEKLIYHNSRLSQEIKKLKQKNADLNIQTRHLQQSIVNKEEQYTIQLKKMEDERQKSLNELENEKKKVAKIIQHISETGDRNLLAEMDKVIGRVDSSTHS